MKRFIHAYAQRHQELTRNFLTRLAAFRTKRLIVLLTPGYEIRVGGVLSIAAIYRKSRALRPLHKATVALSFVPGDPALFRYTWFENSNYLLDLESLLKACGRLDYFLLHIPEYAVNQVLVWLSSVSDTLLRNIGEIHLNVMLQNIDLIEGQDLEGLKHFGRVTCTTAHEAYTNSETRQALGIPLHRLGVFRGPELYSLSDYDDKEPLLIASHDEHPWKQQVLERIAKINPSLKIQVIENVQYEEYRELVNRTKWAITFGEGLDSYFAEPVLSGAVSFAVFNPRFFTPAFAQLRNVYPSWEALANNIAADIQRLDNPESYYECWQETYQLLLERYSTARFRQNLRLFYQGDYTFP